MCVHHSVQMTMYPERVKSDEMNDFPCVPNVHNDNEFETFIVNWLIEKLLADWNCSITIHVELMHSGFQRGKWLIYIYFLHVSCGQQSYGWYPLSGWQVVHEFLEFL